MLISGGKPDASLVISLKAGAGQFRSLSQHSLRYVEKEMSVHITLSN